MLKNAFDPRIANAPDRFKIGKETKRKVDYICIRLQVHPFKNPPFLLVN